MWTRSILKSNAKSVLRRTYWLSFIVTLICTFLANGGSYSKIITEFTSDSFEISPDFFITGSLFAIAYKMFIGGPLSAGSCYFFIHAREYDTDLMDLFKGFTNGSYFHTVGVLIFRQLYIFLWSLLLFIPGIIKSYEYYFIPYIIMENPNISRERAFELSKIMTNGYKWKIFVLELSFYGWALLGTLLCGIGIFFVSPYIEATKAELYAAQRAEVLRGGAADETEFCGFSSNMI